MSTAARFAVMITLGAAGAACTSGSSPRPGAGPSPADPVARPEASTSPAGRRPREAVLAHTEEELHPDPRLRSWNRLWALRNWIRRYASGHGALPERLEDFVPPPGNGVDLEHDGWGGRIVYARVAEGYELRSPGPDGRPGTADDMVATADYLPPRPDDP